MKIVPLGDSALVVRLRDNLDQPESALVSILHALEHLRDAKLPGVTEITPAFISIGIFFDPAKVAEVSREEMPNEWLTKQIHALLPGRTASKKKLRARRVEIPVCYESEFAPDLPRVAEHSGLSAAEVVQRHSAAEYRVHCLGFTPGFAYLSGLPPKLATPRRDTPRKDVPTGAVGIGGEQTGVYPQASPGGWNIIGRSPIRFFDAHSTSPTLLRAGDCVRFRSITAAEFHATTR